MPTFKSWFVMLALSAAATAQAQPVVPTPPSATLERAFVYTFPLHEMGSLRLQHLGDGSAPGRQSLAAWYHLRKLAGATDRQVTTPNNDTLYSLAWLDLSQGPVQLSLPDTQGRYDSVAVLDAYTNNVTILGQRVTGTRDAKFVVVGPRWSGPLPANSRVVRATTDDVLVLARILVNGPRDLPVVTALQDQLGLTPLAAAPGTPTWHRALVRDGSAAAYVDVVNEMLARNPPPAYETELLGPLAEVGLCGAACRWETLPDALKQQWIDGLPILLAKLRERSGQGTLSAGGWSSVRPNLGNFGTDYNYRAVVALMGLLALEPAEAIYPSTRIDDQREPLNGSRRYRLSLPPGGVPANAFWSLSMYQLEPDGRLFFVDNPLSRYALGDRSEGLVRNADGSLDLWIQREAPDASRLGNWLPAPEGNFVLTLRAYHPSAEFRDGRFQLPAVQRLD